MIPRLVLSLALVLPLLCPGLARSQVAATPGASLRAVTFVFRPELPVGHAFLAGTWNDWSPTATEMRRVSDRFEIVVPLPVGEYQYKFVADGVWLTDESAAAFRPDGFGGRNSVLVVRESLPAFDVARGDGRMVRDALVHRQSSWGRLLRADGSMLLAVRTLAGDVERVLAVLDGAEMPIAAARWGTDGRLDYFSAEAEAALVLSSRSYRFLLEDGAARVWLGPGGSSDDPDIAGWFSLERDLLAAFDVPEWVSEGVIYQIFPDRFANGNPANDPDMSEWYYEGARELPPDGTTNGEYFHLVSDWYDVAGLVRSPYRTDGRPDWSSFYGGDIAGIGDRLDYLCDLGVTVLYLNPVFTSKSNHKYDAATYVEVDPHFATNEEFAAFVRACHARGVRVVLDLAFNHTGHTFWAFVDARERGTDSPYWDWYEWARWPVPGDVATTPANASLWYDCWAGFGQMPNLNFDLSRPNAEEPTVLEIAQATPNTPLVEHLLAAARFWVSEIGVDGFRLDVAQEVPPWFWQLFREAVKSADPETYIVGENWGEASEWVSGRGFDAVTNYRFFREPVLQFIARGTMDAPEFDRTLAQGRLVYPEAAVRSMMNLIGSHDTERFLTASGGDVRRLKLALLFAMTYVGVPTIYYGDEIAMVGGRDPDCRRPFDWRWQDDPSRRAVHDYVAKLAALRRGLPCLSKGGFETLRADGMVYAFRRTLDESTAVVIVNAGESEESVSLALGALPASGEGGAVARLVDQVSGISLPIRERSGDAWIDVVVPAFSGFVLTAAGANVAPEGAVPAQPSGG